MIVKSLNNDNHDYYNLLLDFSIFIREVLFLHFYMIDFMKEKVEK